MRIGEFARKAGVGIQTVRFYERRGLLRAPVRTGGGYREYSERELERLAIIRRAQGFGFSLREIGDLLSIIDPPRAAAGRAGEATDHSCIGALIDIGRRRLEVLDGQIGDLRQVRRDLAGLLDQLAGDARPGRPRAPRGAARTAAR
jgi:DNA-binding transcriptional MerR regulator